MKVILKFVFLYIIYGIPTLVIGQHNRFGTSDNELAQQYVKHDGLIYVSGIAENDMQAVSLVQLNTLGQANWQKNYPFSSKVEVNSLISLNGNRLAIAGQVANGVHGNTDGFILIVNNSGQIAKQWVIGSDKFESINNIALAADGDILAAGVSGGTSETDRGTAWVFKISAQGVFDFQYSFVSYYSEAQHIYSLPSGQYFVAGTARDLIQQRKNDVFYLKINENGQLFDQYTISGIDEDQLMAAHINDQRAILYTASKSTSGPNYGGELSVIDVQNPGTSISRFTMQGPLYWESLQWTTIYEGPAGSTILGGFGEVNDSIIPTALLLDPAFNEITTYRFDSIFLGKVVDGDLLNGFFAFAIEDDIGADKQHIVINLDGEFTYECQPRPFNITYQTSDTLQKRTISYGTQVSFAELEELNITFSDEKLIEDFASVNIPNFLKVLEDTILCPPFNIQLNAQAGFDAYFWNSGDIGANINVSTFGTYVVQVVEGCYRFYDTALVLPVLDAIAFEVDDQIICPGEQVTVSIDAFFTNVAWSNGTFGNTQTFNVPGQYIVTGTGSCGPTAVDTFSIRYYEPLYLNLPDTTLECNPTVTLSAQNTGAQYLWFNGQTSQTIEITSEGTYPVAVMLCNDTLRDTAVIRFEDPFIGLWAPSAFTPNQDHLNEVYFVKGTLTELTSYEMSIFNRWGQCIFENKTPKLGWNGYVNNKGKAAPIGTYVVLIKYQTTCSGDAIFEKRIALNLIR